MVKRSRCFCGFIKKLLLAGTLVHLRV